MDYRLCERCWTWVENRIGTHPCNKRPRPDVLPVKPGSETRHLTVPEQKVMQKALRASVKIVDEPKAAEKASSKPMKARARLTALTEKAEPVAEAPAQPDPKIDPVCQQVNPSTARSRKWREGNREKVRSDHREYMRKRRTAAREAGR